MVSEERRKREAMTPLLEIYVMAMDPARKPILLNKPSKQKKNKVLSLLKQHSLDSMGDGWSPPLRRT
jgi:hypothetical protein